MATAPSARYADGRSSRGPRTPLQPQRLARAMPMPLVLHSRWRALERRKRVGLHKQPFLPLTVVSIRLAVAAVAVLRKERCSSTDTAPLLAVL